MSHCWYIALIPCEPEYTAIENFISTLSSRIPFIELPKKPRHITIIAPFVADEPRAISTLDKLRDTVGAFQVNTTHFAYFNESKVWYIAIDQHPLFRTLERLGRTSLGDLAPKTYPDRVYHLTIAHNPIAHEDKMELDRRLKPQAMPCEKLSFTQIALLKKEHHQDARLAHAVAL